MSDIKIGADPEFFLRDTETGNLVSAYGMIEGTKHDPLKVECGAVQVDGMALEFNIDPASSWREFDQNIVAVLRQLREKIPSRYAFEFIPVAHFGKEYIDAQPDEAKQLGCDPDYSAWTKGINPKPNGDLGFRTASGHIHIGWTNEQDITHPEHIEACEMMSKQLDITLGLFSLLFDTDTTRRQMYGQFGVYRPKHYGVEYRTLSNVWVNNPSLRRGVYHQAIFAADQLMQGAQYYTHINPFNIDRSMTTLRDLADFTLGTVPIHGDAGRGFRDIINTARGSRQYALDFRAKVAQGYFHHHLTFEQRPWDEITPEMANSREWQCDNAYASKAKRNGWTKCTTPEELRAAQEKSEAELRKFLDESVSSNTIKAPSRKKSARLNTGAINANNINWDGAVIVDDFLAPAQALFE